MRLRAELLARAMDGGSITLAPSGQAHGSLRATEIKAEVATPQVVAALVAQDKVANFTERAGAELCMGWVRRDEDAMSVGSDEEERRADPEEQREVAAAPVSF